MKMSEKPSQYRLPTIILIQIGRDLPTYKENKENKEGSVGEQCNEDKRTWDGMKRNNKKIHQPDKMQNIIQRTPKTCTKSNHYLDRTRNLSHWIPNLRNYEGRRETPKLSIKYKKKRKEKHTKRVREDYHI